MATKERKEHIEFKRTVIPLPSVFFAVRSGKIGHFGEGFFTTKDTKSTKKDRRLDFAENFVSFVSFVVKIGFRLAALRSFAAILQGFLN